MHGMADKDKSREVRKPTIEVGDCEQDVCCGTGEYETSNRESFGELTIKIQADVKDALKGFKALQRELRETTKAARELEQAYKALEDVPMQINEHGRLEPIIIVEMDSKEIGKADSKGTVQINESFRLSDIPTKVLHEELAQREGVKEYVVNLGGTAKLSVDNDGEGFSKTFGGPARIIVNRD